MNIVLSLLYLHVYNFGLEKLRRSCVFLIPESSFPRTIQVLSVYLFFESFYPHFCVVTVRLQPIGSAPHLNQRVFKLSTNQQFATIVRFLRKRLGVKEHESVFCYIGSVFSPALDEGIGNLWSVSSNAGIVRK